MWLPRIVLLGGALLLTACGPRPPAPVPDLTPVGPVRVEDRAASGLVGLERKTGRVLWKRGDLPTQVTAYTYPVLVVFNGEGFMGLYTVLDVRTGRTLRTLDRSIKVLALEPGGRLFLLSGGVDSLGLHLTVQGWNVLSQKALYQKTQRAAFKRHCFTADIPTVDLEVLSAVRVREVRERRFTLEAQNRCEGPRAEKVTLTFSR